MKAVRLTAIMKTDLRGSTPHFRALAESDLAALLAGHRDLVSQLSAAQDGRIIKSEGDAFWIVFPSVTAAALAAVTIQEELARTQLNKGDNRLAVRIVITVGDVLHEDGDIFGDAVALAARIESVTPADEIYLSAAARLAISQAEVRTALVDAFALKGFTETVPVYRIEQSHRTQILTDQCIVFTDLQGFSSFSDTAPVNDVERVLDRLRELVEQLCREFNGSNRFSVGDAHCLTFAAGDHAMAAAERLVQQWDRFSRREQVSCPMKAAAHRGNLRLFRSYCYGNDINIVARLANEVKRRPDASEGFFYVTAPLCREVLGSPWQARLAPVEIAPIPRHLVGIEVFRVEICGSGARC